VLRNFIAIKNPSSWAGFKPANRGYSGKHVTTTAPKAIEPKLEQMQMSYYFLSNLSQS
jgi:hypothetical protein